MSIETTDLLKTLADPLFFWRDSTTIISTSVLTISTTILPPNQNRLAFMLYNNSANSGYFTFSSVSSSNKCSFIVPTFANWYWPFSNIYFSGALSCIRNSGSGNVIVTEFLR